MSKKVSSKPENEEVNKDIEALQNELALLKEELTKEREAKLGTMADFANFRKHIDTERSKFGLMTNMMLVSSLIEILDEITMAQMDDTMDIARAREVLSLFSDKLNSSLELAGLEKLDLKPGDKFDSNIMEAITSIPANEEFTTDTVVSIVSNAYRYRGKEELIKTAKVVVAR